MAASFTPDGPAPKRPWLGTMLSLLAPGFGLLRAGRPLRGLTWFAGLHGFAFAGSLLWIWRAVPTALAIGAWLAWIGAYIIMLVDSWRPGRLRAAWWVALVAAVPLSLALGASRRLVAHAYKMPTHAMQPTLRAASSSGAADHFIADRLAYRFALPQRGDLVVFRTGGIARIPQPEVVYIKRLVGLPGERVVIKEGRVFADGRQLGPSDGIPAEIDYFNHPSTEEPGFDVPEGSYFMLGDNSQQSYDSRYWGGVPQANIIGRVARIYYPFARASVPR